MERESERGSGSTRGGERFKRGEGQERAGKRMSERVREMRKCQKRERGRWCERVHDGRTRASTQERVDEDNSEALHAFTFGSSSSSISLRSFATLSSQT
eukprot:1357468-Pleurochrysis_carterae.AAC.1